MTQLESLDPRDLCQIKSVLWNPKMKLALLSPIQKPRIQRHPLMLMLHHHHRYEQLLIVIYWLMDCYKLSGTSFEFLRSDLTSNVDLGGGFFFFFFVGDKKDYSLCCIGLFLFNP